jgi:hypothetical protein
MAQKKPRYEWQADALLAWHQGIPLQKYRGVLARSPAITGLEPR